MTQGRESISDIRRLLPNHQPDPHPPWVVLRGRVWLSYMINCLGSIQELETKVYRGKTDSGLVRKWVNGTTMPTRISVENLQNEVQGSLELFELPLWTLLADRPMGSFEIKRLIAPYHNSDEPFEEFWRFPNDAELAAQNRLRGGSLMDDTDGLFQRGDLYGFMAIIAVVRDGELHDHIQHRIACANMYRCLPAIYKLPWFVDNRSLLEACLASIRARMFLAWQDFDIDWDVINRQAADPNHEPTRERRPRDPKTWRFVDLEDPILYPELVRGAEVKRRRLARESASRSRRARRATPTCSRPLASATGTAPPQSTRSATKKR